MELRRLAAWLSALVGNTAFHTADHAAASIHFGTAARLGTAVGDHDLICWTLGAQSMTACSQGKPQQAVELAAEALEYARTPLRRAQIIAWGATARDGCARSIPPLGGGKDDGGSPERDGGRPARRPARQVRVRRRRTAAASG
ncbi:tetratricopeptide repeat protein [Nonomuraea ferruginea]